MKARTLLDCLSDYHLHSLNLWSVFHSQVTVLPPGEWDPSIRIEPPDAVPSQDKRLESAKSGAGGGGGGGGEEHDPAGDREEQLRKTGRLEELACILK